MPTMKTTPQTPTPQTASDLPRLPIDVNCYNVELLRSITGDQLWFAGLLIELRGIHDLLADLRAKLDGEKVAK